MTTTGKATALIGAQYGSEGKGVVAYHLRDRFSVHVRVGGPNAGHTFRHRGQLWKMQSIPVGWTNPTAWLVIGAGAVIDVQQLLHEVSELEAAGYEVKSRLLVDPAATVITETQKEWEGGVGGEAHRLIGSTGKGVGLARMGRINRGKAIFADTRLATLLARDSGALVQAQIELRDTAEFLRGALGAGEEVLLEGTQGSGLSLIHGPWPFVTSADTNAAQLAADCGIGPSDVGHVILVARTLPIRVAGNSGPLRDETTWDELGLEEERTTVTHKVRRVGGWDPELVRRALLLNGGASACSVVLTFLDYLFPEIEGFDGYWPDLPPAVRDCLRDIEEEIGCPVVAVGTGGEDFAMSRWDGSRIESVKVR